MRRNVLSNASWIIGCKIIQALLGVVISMLTARYLGPSQFGTISYAAAIVAFVTPITKLGLTYIIVQEIVNSPDEEGKILGSSMIVSLISSVLCIIGVISFSIVANPSDKETIIVCALYSILLIAQSTELIQYWFQAKLLSKYPSVVSVIIYIVISIYKAILLLAKMGIGWFAVSNAIDHMIIGVVLIVLYHKKSQHKLAFSFSWAKRLLGKGKYFIVSSMMVTIFAQTDRIMLKFMVGEVATGVYSAACSCATMTSFVFLAVIDSVRPTIFEHKNQSKELYETSICCLYAIVIFMALAQSMAMTLLARPIICVLYGQEYLDAISVLRIVVWYTTFAYIGSVRTIWILSEGKQKCLWVINLFGAITNIILNSLLIPKFGVEGAAIASVITQSFTHVISSFIIKSLRYSNVLMMRSCNPKFLIDTIKTVIDKNQHKRT